jgi:hypothetical protein
MTGMRFYAVGFAIILCLVLPLPLRALDPSAFIAGIENFSERIFSETKSAFSLSSSDVQFRLPNTPFQCVQGEKADNGGKDIRIQTGCPSMESGANHSKYLVDTALLQIQSPEIKGQAKKYKRSSSGIKEIEAFVFGHISHKTIGNPLINAVHVYRNRSGDCKEHTVLTVSLLRAVGVPSRAVVGMVAVKEFLSRKNIFVYHMWAEAYMDKKWILVDSTAPGKKYPNRYVAFAYHNLKTESPISYLKAIASIKDLRVRYINTAKGE